MTENKRFTLHKGLDTLNIMDNTKFNEHIYINKSSKDMELLVGVLNELHEENQSLKQSFDLINKVRKELIEENEQLQFENNELKCALALDEVDYIIADGKKIDIPPYYEFERRYDSIMHRREYDGYD